MLRSDGFKPVATKHYQGRYLPGFLTFFLACCVVTAAQAQEVSDSGAVVVKAPRVERAIPITHIESISGFVGNRLEKNKDQYLKQFPIEEYVGFLEQRTHRGWDWKQAEQPGKWIESSVWTSLRTGDAQLDAKVHEMVDRLIASQEPEGYVGATDPEVRTPEKPLRGMDAYELYFLHHALMTAYEQWQEPRALQAAERLADYFVKYIGPGKAEFWPTDDRYPENVGKTYRGTKHSDLAGHSLHYSWEGSLLIDPMLRLYQLTGEQRYFDWSQWVIGNLDKWSGWDAFSKLDSVADGTMDVNDIQPYVHAHTFQMNFLGLLRMYQLTGDASYLRKVAGVWDDVAERQMFITGGVAVGEHYERDYLKPLTGEMVETCATMSWLQLSQYLLELTGDTKYADAMERLLWNHVFAAQAADGTCNRYDTPPNGFKPEGYFRRPDCCTGSGHRLLSMLPAFLYATSDDALYINQFMPTEAAVDLNGKGTIQVAQTAHYPEEETVVVEISPEQKTRFTVKIRIPAWCQAPQLSVNGKAVKSIQPGTYATLTRKWKPGDRIELHLPMELRWVQREHHMEVSDRKPYPAKPDPNPPYALLRGPIVYVADNLWYEGDTAQRPHSMMEEAAFVLQDPATLETVATPQDDMLGPGYVVPLQLKNGQSFDLRMFPFANLGIWYRDASAKPDPESEAYSYAIWLKGKKEE
ncbi:glycoside hydrolase family 127 protein [Catalinimonas alkaloidigena]|nr:beta-L-arabinofuranosidase domain-containing protein [Catalinimonas alkaloidigena]